jgi:alcohol dehydrogenase
MGVPDTILARGDGSELAALQELTGGALAQVVIDATGHHVSMGKALNYVAFTGRLVFVGITTQEIAFGHPLMHRREMTLLASRNALPPDFTRIIRLIEEGRIDTRPWITHQANFEQVPAEFPRWIEPASGVIKAIVTVD